MTPIGTYRARAMRGEFGESKKKGTAYVRVPFQIVDGEHKGEVVQWGGYFTDKTTERTIESLRSCGCTFPGDDVTNLEGLGTQDVEVVVEHETYTRDDGEERMVAKVQWVNGLGGIPEEQKMSDTRKRSFASQMKGAIKATSKPRANGAPPAQRQPEPQPNGDDIPF